MDKQEMEKMEGGKREGEAKGEKERGEGERKLTHPFPVVYSVSKLHHREEERQRVKGGHSSNFS